MKLLPALALLLALGAPAVAQTQSDLVEADVLAELKAALKQSNTEAAARRAAEAKKPKAFAKRKVVSSLVDRLDSDGYAGQAEDGWEARTFYFNGQPDASGNFVNSVATLIERPLPAEGKNGIIYLVLRRELSHLQLERQVYTALAGGRAMIESWAFRVELDGQITICNLTTRTGKVVAPRTISVDPADGYVEKLESLSPPSSAARQAWLKLEKLLPFLGRIYEV